MERRYFALGLLMFGACASPEELPGPEPLAGTGGSAATSSSTGGARTSGPLATGGSVVSRATGGAAPIVTAAGGTVTTSAGGGTGSTPGGTGSGSSQGGNGSGSSGGGEPLVGCPAPYSVSSAYPQAGTHVEQEGIEYVSCFYVNPGQQPKSASAPGCSGYGQPWGVIGPCEEEGMGGQGGASP